jgi:hypothetical protein
MDSVGIALEAILCTPVAKKKKEKRIDPTNKKK